MSRRDIIIVAVLLNVAVLSFLFLTATRPEDEDSYHPSYEQAIALESVGVLSDDHAGSKVITLDLMPRDEVDTILKPYLNTHKTVSSSQDPSTRPVVYGVEESEVILQPAPKVTSVALPVATEESYREVTVKRGDVLEKIARAQGISVKELKRVNHLTSDKISIGQVLQVPESEAKAAPKPATASLATESAALEYYVVKPGDNPWKIARQNKVKLDELLLLNALTEDSARNLKVGDKIRVR